MRSKFYVGLKKQERLSLQPSETWFFMSTQVWTKRKWSFCIDADCPCGFLRISYRATLTKRNPQSQLFEKGTWLKDIEIIQYLKVKSLWVLTSRILYRVCQSALSRDSWKLQQARPCYVRNFFSFVQSVSGHETLFRRL